MSYYPPDKAQKQDLSSEEEILESPELTDQQPAADVPNVVKYPHLNIPQTDAIPPKNHEVGEFLHSSVPLLGALNTEECGIVGAYMEVRQYKRDELIIKQGDVGQGMFILRSGSAKVSRLEDGAKTPFELDTVSPGDYFGEGALVSSAPRGASVIATAPCTALYLSSQHFHTLFDRPDGQGTTLTFAKRGTIRSNAMQTHANGTVSNGSHHTSGFSRFFGGGANNSNEFDVAQDKLTSLYEVRMPVSPILTKDDKTHKMLYDALKDQVLFIGMENEHKLRAIANMWKITVPKDQVIIRQGDIGDNLYVLESGKVGVYIKSADGKSLRKVDSVSKPGKSFGELALLYNTPRNATVKAKAKTTLWVLDRLTFRRLMRNVTEERLRAYVDFLQSVPLFQPLSNNERSRIAEAIETSVYRDGEHIVKEGDRGETMFIILDGVVQVSKSIGGGKSCVVNTLKQGDFFGERSLLENEIRTATVTCVGRVEVAKIDQYAFKLLLGPVTDTLTERMQESIKRDKMVGEIKTDLVHMTSETIANLKKQRVILANKNPDLKLEDLEVIGFLGKGGYGYVELVKHKRTTQTYALKTLYRAHIIRTKSMINVLNEKKMLQRMDSPYIIHLYATYKDNQKLQFLLEPCLGGELFTLLRARGVFAEKAARFYAASVILALEEIHSHGVVYRDLKPENLLLDNEGFIKVTDFGLSKLIGDTRTFTVCGTPHYLAPEIIQGTGHGKSVDLWCLGVLIYEMLAGRPPFYRPGERGDHMRLYRRITCCDFQPSSMFSEDSWDLIQRLLQFKPSSRLGAGSAGFDRLRKHQWFAGIEWNALQQRNLRAPIIPYIRTNEDLTNFKKPAPNYKQDPNQLHIPQNVDQTWDEDF
eukprot:UN00524